MASRDQMLDRARQMRRNPTEPEKRLWRHVSNAGLHGYKFRRQAVVGPYICDFLCPAKNLAIEVDGDTHNEDKDGRRDLALAEHGVHVLHVTNQDVMQNMDGVLQMIIETLDQMPDRWERYGRHPNPPPQTGEGV